MILTPDERDAAMLAWLRREFLLSAWGVDTVRTANHPAGEALDILEDADPVGHAALCAWLRGWDRAADTAASDIEPTDSPMSGEWAGESVTELVGDLLVFRGDRFYDDDDDAIVSAYEDGYGAVRDIWHHGASTFHGDAECAF